MRICRDRVRFVERRGIDCDWRCVGYSGRPPAVDGVDLRSTRSRSEVRVRHDRRARIWRSSSSVRLDSWNAIVVELRRGRWSRRVVTRRVRTMIGPMTWESGEVRCSWIRTRRRCRRLDATQSATSGLHCRSTPLAKKSRPLSLQGGTHIRDESDPLCRVRTGTLRESA